MSDYADPSSGHLRLSDAEREQAVQRLSAARGDGRLDADEFARRAAAARAAVTRSDLAPLFADLPGTAPVAAPSGYAPDRSWDRGPNGSRALGGGVGATIMALVPFLALALFFAFGFAGGWAWSWLFFLLVPLAGIIIYGPGADERARRR